MNKQLRVVSRTVFAMFLALFVAVTTIQVVTADELRAHPNNQRTVKNSFQVERGSILVGGETVATSIPSESQYRWQRVYNEPMAYAPVTGYFSHYQGATGLERQMNAELSGTGGGQFFSRFMRIFSGQDPQGSSIELSIDPAAQQAAYDAMEGYRGAVVALEPATGRILAMVSTPSFDPNELAVTDNSTIIQNYNALIDDPSRPMINRAIAGDTYHPGSTFKIITAAAAIEHGNATASTEYGNPTAYTLPGSTSQMRNYSRGACGPGSSTTLEYAFIQSCNIQFAEMANALPLGTLSETAAGFGFDTEVSIPLPVTESTAPVPEDQAQQALSAIGQWNVSATPLQMAMVSAGVANDGVVMQPTLVDRVITPDLRVESETAPSVLSTAVSPSTAKQLQELMVKSVNSGVAGEAAISGVTVAGKTGTAETGTDENGNALPFTIWFTGFAPADDPQVAVAVVVEDAGGERWGYNGSSSVIPTQISKQVMEAVLSE